MIKLQNICRKTKEKLKCKFILDMTPNIRFDSQTTKHSNKLMFQIIVQIPYCAMLFTEEMHQDMHYGIALAAMKLTTLAHCSTTFVKWRRRFFGNFFFTCCRVEFWLLRSASPKSKCHYSGNSFFNMKIIIL